MVCFLTETVPGRRRIDPEYCRRKAALCRELAELPANRTQARLLVKMAERFDRQASWPDE